MSWLSDLFSPKPKRPPQPTRDDMLREARDKYREIKARYDAAQWSTDFEKHWGGMTDNLSPARSVDPTTRARLRERSRYEVLENNSYGLGIVLSKANDVIGLGPSLRITGSTVPKPNYKQLQRSFNAWADEINLSAKLNTAYMNKVVSGEIFMLPTTNPFLDHPVKLDIRLIEAEQIAHPTFTPTGSGWDDFDPLTTDGVHFDEYGNVTAYDILKEHPGSVQQFGQMEYDIVAAANVIHLFRQDRPAQPRGIPETTAALPLFAYLRRYTLATIAAAEVAADFAAVIETDGAVSDDLGQTFAPLAPEEVMDIDRGAMVTLPWGWRMSQLKAEHPTTTYNMFHDAILGEIARCLQMPFNRAAGNSINYTFASGKLDRDSYLDHVDCERQQLNVIVLNKLFRWWWDEAALIPGVIPRVGPLHLLQHQWYWSPHREADPQKQAAADVTYQKAGWLLDEDFWLARGLDPDEQYRKLADQNRRRAEAGSLTQDQQQMLSGTVPPQGDGVTQTDIDRPTETAGLESVNTTGVINEVVQGNEENQPEAD